MQFPQFRKTRFTRQIGVSAAQSRYFRSIFHASVGNKKFQYAVNCRIAVWKYHHVVVLLTSTSANAAFALFKLKIYLANVGDKTFGQTENGAAIALSVRSAFKLKGNHCSLHALGQVRWALNHSVSLSFVSLLEHRTEISPLLQVKTMLPFIDFTVPFLLHSFLGT